MFLEGGWSGVMSGRLSSAVGARFGNLRPQVPAGADRGHTRSHRRLQPAAPNPLPAPAFPRRLGQDLRLVRGAERSGPGGGRTRPVGLCHRREQACQGLWRELPVDHHRARPQCDRQTLNELLGTEFGKPPSDSAFRLLLAQLDVAGFETHLRDWMAAQPGVTEELDTLVRDGKTPRGSIVAENDTGAAR